MMYHHVQDRHPGRCLNHRTEQYVQLRCLRMEGHDGRCRFDKPAVITTFASGVFQLPEPEPWVEPPEAPE